jgi:hypothetical protein
MTTAPPTIAAPTTAPHPVAAPSPTALPETDKLKLKRLQKELEILQKTSATLNASRAAAQDLKKM